MHDRQILPIEPSVSAQQTPPDRNHGVEESTSTSPSLAQRKLLGLRHHEWRLIAIVVSIKLLLFLFVGQSYQVLADQQLTGLRNWFSIWNRWDAANYQRLAQFGYSATGDQRPLLVFYPLYPWTVRAFTFITHDFLFSAFIVSTIASLIVAILLTRLVELDHSKELAQRAVWLLFIFPTSYFLHIGYTESLFLMFALGSFFAARKGQWMIAAVAGALACLTRGNGIVLIPALAIEAAHQYYTTRRWRWSWLWIIVVGFGFGGYLLLNKVVTGDPFAFIPIRAEFFRISLAGPWVGISETFGSMNRNPSQAEVIGMQEFLFIVFGFVCTVISWVKLRPSYSIWMTFNWLLVVSVSFVSSVPRYTLTMFPVFILMSMLAARRVWLAIITCWSILYLSFFATLFAWGRWAF